MPLYEDYEAHKRSFFASLASRIDGYDAELAQLRSTLAERVAEIAALGAQVSAERSAKETAQAQANTERRAKEVAQAQVATLNAEITRLQARIAELEAETPAPTEPTSGLFFKLPARNASDTVVLAHYFPVFPLAMSNENPTTDYYARNWMPVAGENGQHATYGGRLRDRPLTNAPYPGDWRRNAAKEEIEAAIKYGIDGFFVNLMSTGHANVYNALRDEANANFKGFHVVPMVDTNGSLVDNQTNLVKAVSSFIATDNALRLPNGKYAVGSFKAEGRDAAWWTRLATDVKAASGRDIDFLHIYNSSSIGSLPQYGAGIWGPGTDPVTVNAWAGIKSQTTARGVKTVQPIWAQDVRVKSGNSDEVRGFGGLRASWDKAVEADPEFAQMATWDDYTEASHFKPSAMRGTALLEYSAYRIAEMRLGGKPEILKDAIFVSHRNQTLNATVTGGQTVMMKQWRSPTPGRGSTVTDGFREEVEVLTFLTRPQRVTVTVGGQATSYDAPAGEFSRYVPARAGEVKVSLSGGLEFTSPIRIRSTVVNQDRAYAFSSSLGNANKQYDPTPGGTA